jgi:drug/metabolite transporter (DMT)-like permease
LAAPVPSASTHAHTRQAVGTLVASAVVFGFMAVTARVASRRIPAAEVAMFRFLLGVLVVAVVAVTGRATLRPTKWGWLLMRGIFGGTAVLLYFSCIEHVGAGLATLLNYTAPVWTMLLGWWLLGERPRRTAAVALVLTLLGVVGVVGGSLRTVHNGVWALAGVFSAMASGVAITSIRAVRRRSADGAGESAWTVFASFTGFGLLVTLPGVFGPLGRWVTPLASDWGILAAVAVLSVVAQLLMTQALEHVTGATMGIIHQLTVIVAMLCGVLFLGERLAGWSLVGSVLTVSGVAWTVLTASRPLSPPPAPDA